MKSYITIFLLISNTLIGSNLITLIASSPSAPSQTITLVEGEVFTLIDHQGLTPTLSGSSWEINGDLNLKVTKESASYYFKGEKDSLVIAGPAEIQLFHGEKVILDEAGNLLGSKTTATMITAKVESSNSIGELIVSNSSVVLPSDGTGNFSVTLESSVDLVNWNTATPGIYGSSSNQRFFRVKATEVID